MVKVRLIYEQIEAAKGHLLTESLLGFRLALILLDNVAELLMYGELRRQFAFDDELRPQGEPAHAEWLRAGFGPKYSLEERHAAEREFDPKTRILCVRLGRISNDDRAILKVCHKLRCEAFHGGRLRRGLLGQSAKLLFLTTVNLTLKLPIRSFKLPGSRPAPDDAQFLERFGIRDAFLLGTDDGRRHLADQLLGGIAFDESRFAESLSYDLVERIEETLGGLEYLAESSSDIDRNLQYTQFWRDCGGTLAASGVQEPDLENAFRTWQSEGKAKFTLNKIEGWRRQAESIGRCDVPAHALDRYWAIDPKLRPLEEDVAEAVFRYDEEINSRIH